MKQITLIDDGKVNLPALIAMAQENLAELDRQLAGHDSDPAYDVMRADRQKMIEALALFESLMAPTAPSQ